LQQPGLWASSPDSFHVLLVDKQQRIHTKLCSDTAFKSLPNFLSLHLEWKETREHNNAIRLHLVPTFWGMLTQCYLLLEIWQLESSLFGNFIQLTIMFPILNCCWFELCHKGWRASSIIMWRNSCSRSRKNENCGVLFIVYYVL
jgi:hypothetical protein